MLRIAVQYPHMLLNNPAHDFNGNRAIFIRDIKPIIYWPQFKYRFTRGIGFREQLKKSPFLILMNMSLPLV